MDKKTTPKVSCRIVKYAEEKPIMKAETSTQLSTESSVTANDWLPQPEPLGGYEKMVDHSSILPQCIGAYKRNIAGFGIGIRYKDEDEKPSAEMEAEFNKATEIIELFNMDMDTKEVFEHVIEARETYGIAYVEVIRNLDNEVVGLEFIKNTPAVQKTMPLLPMVPVEFFYKERIEQRPKKFCKYKQEINGGVVYFKEFGDPRIMDNRNGDYVPEGEDIDIQYRSNELLEFAIGVKPYGKVRWVGQILGTEGSRKAEGLNYRYFTEGRHTPLLISVNGGTLTEDSFTKLKEYMQGIKGEEGQHAFIILEAEDTENSTGIETEDKPKIEIHDLAKILQKDELFQDYIDNSRQRVQSAFLLPDLYVGYTRDFNRATAQAAAEKTEEQVFQPERSSLAWTINHKLLNAYQFKYVEAYFMAPDVTNLEDLARIMTISERAGGLSPNKAKEILYSLMGEKAEAYDGEWGNVPRTHLSLLSATNTNGAVEVTPVIKSQSSNDEVVAVMKAVRSILKQLDKSGGATDG